MRIVPPHSEKASFPLETLEPRTPLRIRRDPLSSLAILQNLPLEPTRPSIQPSKESLHTPTFATAVARVLLSLSASGDLAGWLSGKLARA